MHDRVVPGIERREQGQRHEQQHEIHAPDEGHFPVQLMKLGGLRRGGWSAGGADGLAQG